MDLLSSKLKQENHKVSWEQWLKPLHEKVLLVERVDMPTINIATLDMLKRGKWAKVGGSGENYSASSIVTKLPYPSKDRSSRYYAIQSVN